MVSGFVSGGTQVVFSKKRKFSVWATDDDVVISRHNLTGPVCMACHCPDCKKVIIDYGADIKRE